MVRLPGRLREQRAAPSGTRIHATPPDATRSTGDIMAQIESLTLGLDRGLSASVRLLDQTALHVHTCSTLPTRGSLRSTRRASHPEWTHSAIVQMAQAQNIKEFIDKLEKESQPVKLTWVAAGQVQCGMDLLDGVWRLVYSSAFESGNLGGSRPGPPAELAPVRLVRYPSQVHMCPHKYTRTKQRTPLWQEATQRQSQWHKQGATVCPLHHLTPSARVPQRGASRPAAPAPSPATDHRQTARSQSKRSTGWPLMPGAQHSPPLPAHPPPHCAGPDIPGH